jgi:hypothetical protein
MDTARTAFRGIAAALLVFAMALSGPGRADAAPATNLKCKGCVGSKDLGKNAVKNKNVKTGTIDSRAIKDHSIAPADLSAGATPSGVAFNESLATGLVPDTLTSILSATLTAPAAGYAVVTASWTYYANVIDSFASCNLTTTTGSGDGFPVLGNSGPSTFYRDPSSTTRTFAVPQGQTTFYLDCSDVGTNMNYAYPIINAVFVPNKY